MKRFDCKTDIALIGIWDISLIDESIRNIDFADIEPLIEDKSRKGHLFYIETGGDGSGFIDVYVDEDIPKEVKAYCNESKQSFLLLAPRGELKCDGLEVYLNGKKSNENDILEVPAGKYRVECYPCKDYDELEDIHTEQELKKQLPVEDIEYFDKKTTGAFKWAFIVTIIVFAITILTTKWYVALAASFVAFIAFFHVYEAILAKDKKYQELTKIIPQYRISKERPAFVFCLKKVTAESPAGEISITNDQVN